MAEIIIIGIIVAGILFYNSLVAKKNEVDNIDASVDTLLKKRYDLIPNLVATLQEYMKYEEELLTKITSLRSKAIQGDRKTKEALEKDFQSTFSSLMVAVENYPDLKADKQMIHLQHTLAEIEEQISAARRAYNQAVTDYNNALEMIPTNIIASFLKYKPRELFDIPEEQKAPINIKELFRK